MDNSFLLIVLLLVLGFLLPFLIFLIKNLKNILPYLYANARIKAKEARFIKPETLDEMINTGSVAEIASILENSEYALAMQGLVLENAESIEDLLIRQTADVYSEVSKMFPEKMARVLSFLRQQWDVKNLKTIMRGVRSGLTAEKIISKTVPFGEIDSEFLKKLSESGSLEDLLTSFEGSSYDKLSALLPLYEQEKSLLPVEAMLDKILLEGMWNAVTSENELTALVPGFAARIDALNLKIMLRAKNDHLLFADIENHFIAGGDIYKSASGVFDEIDEVSALLAELEGTIFYKPLMEALPDYEKDGSLYVLEKAIEETALTVGKDAALKQPYGIAPVLGFLSMKDTEIRNIRAITRAKEAGLSPDKIKEFVLRV